jgi:hypothetical protein
MNTNTKPPIAPILTKPLLPDLLRRDMQLHLRRALAELTAAWTLINARNIQPAYGRGSNPFRDIRVRVIPARRIDELLRVERRLRTLMQNLELDAKRAGLELAP